jgi:hypothetical protein
VSWKSRFDDPVVLPSGVKLIYDAVMQLPPEQRRDRRAVNEAIRLADPDAQR